MTHIIIYENPVLTENHCKKKKNILQSDKRGFAIKKKKIGSLYINNILRISFYFYSGSFVFDDEDVRHILR